MCTTCNGKGLAVANWDGSPPDYAVCLCPMGVQMRTDVNGGKQTGFALWQVWAYTNQVDPSRIFLLEEVLTPAELAARGLVAAQQQGGHSREAALLAAGKTRRVKL